MRTEESWALILHTQRKRDLKTFEIKKNETPKDKQKKGGLSSRTKAISPLSFHAFTHCDAIAQETYTHLLEGSDFLTLVAQTVVPAAPMAWTLSTVMAGWSGYHAHFQLLIPSAPLVQHLTRGRHASHFWTLAPWSSHLGGVAGSTVCGLVPDCASSPSHLPLIWITHIGR